MISPGSLIRVYSDSVQWACPDEYLLQRGQAAGLQIIVKTPLRFAAGGFFMLKNNFPGK